MAWRKRLAFGLALVFAQGPAPAWPQAAGAVAGEWMCRIEYGGGYQRIMSLVLAEDSTWLSEVYGGVSGPSFGLGRWSENRIGVISLQGQETRYLDPELSSRFALSLRHDGMLLVSKEPPLAECRRLQ